MYINYDGGVNEYQLRPLHKLQQGTSVCYTYSLGLSHFDNYQLAMSLKN